MKAKKIKEEIPGKSKTSCLIHLSFVEVKLRKKILPIQSVVIWHSQEHSQVLFGNQACKYMKISPNDENKN